MSVAGLDPPRTDGRRPRLVNDPPGRADRIFSQVTFGSGMLVLVVLALVGIFLLWQSRHAFASSGLSFFTSDKWLSQSNPPHFGVLGLLVGTLLVSAVSMVLAVPFGICAALFITEYAGDRPRQILRSVIDLLASVPSLLFGLWGFLFLSKQVAPLSGWLSRHFSWIPIFQTDAGVNLTGSIFIAGIVVSLMVLPIITSIVVEVFSQTPPGEKEAALALGGTRWGMIRTVVLPFGRGGMIGGSMLGLGRALGETIAVALLLPGLSTVTFKILQNGSSTIAGYIAEEANTSKANTGGLLAAGLVLFILTLATNMAASLIVSRSRSGAGVEA